MIYLSKIMDFPCETTIKTMILGQDFVKCGSGKLGIPGHHGSIIPHGSFHLFGMAMAMGSMSPTWRHGLKKTLFFAAPGHSFWKVDTLSYPLVN
jgi:hypothetical protein